MVKRKRDEMMRHTVFTITLLAVIGVAGVSFLVNSGILGDLFPRVSEITCPKDGSPYVWTPVGSRSENFGWLCLRCGYSWIETYPEDIYLRWRKAFLEPDFVRDYVLLYMRHTGQGGLPDPLTLEWVGAYETHLLGRETYVYRAMDTVVKVAYPVVLAEYIVYDIRVEESGVKAWEGRLHQRQFTTDASTPLDRATYDYYGGVGLFERGIHIIATEYDPVPHFGTDGHWKMLKDHTTQRASTCDFVSILISRGDFVTGGYQIQLKSFARLQSYPVVFSFSANFTNPGEGVAVTEAFTNPLVIVPLGNLNAGKYVVEVHTESFTLTYDTSGKPVYVPIQTLMEEVWKFEFAIQ